MSIGYLVVSISLEVFVHRDSRALVGLDEVGAVDNDVHVGDGEYPAFAYKIIFKCN